MPRATGLFVEKIVTGYFALTRPRVLGVFTVHTFKKD
jgi:hypothetical protein